MTLEPNQTYRFNNFRFDAFYYNKNSENDLYTFLEFCEVVKNICKENGYNYLEKKNSYKKNPELIEIEIKT